MINKDILRNGFVPIAFGIVVGVGHDYYNPVCDYQEKYPSLNQTDAKKLVKLSA